VGGRAPPAPVGGGPVSGARRICICCFVFCERARSTFAPILLCFLWQRAVLRQPVGCDNPTEGVGVADVSLAGFAGKRDPLGVFRVASRSDPGLGGLLLAKSKSRNKRG